MQLPCRRLRRPRRVLRHGPAASCSAPLVPRLRCLSTAHAKDASLAAATASVAATAPASIKDSNVSRRAREPSDGLAKPRALPRSGCGLCRPSNGGASRSAPAAPQSDVANPCPCRCISPATPGCVSIPETAPRRRQPARLPRPRRISACRPVSRSVGAPADHAAKGGSKVALPYHWHQAGTSPRV